MGRELGRQLARPDPELHARQRRSSLRRINTSRLIAAKTAVDGVGTAVMTCIAPVTPSPLNGVPSSKPVLGSKEKGGVLLGSGLPFNR